MLLVAVAIVVVITVVGLGIVRARSSGAEARQFAIGLAIGVVLTALLAGPIADRLEVHPDQPTWALYVLITTAVCVAYLVLERRRPD